MSRLSDDPTVISYTWEELQPRTDAEIAAGVTPVNYRFMPTPIRDISRYVSDNTGTDDVLDEIQAAVNVAKIKGGEVYFPPGTYLANGSIQLENGVLLIGPYKGEGTASAAAALATIKSAVGGDLIKTAGGVDVFACGVIGLKLHGPGALVASRGIHFDQVSRGIVRYCYIDNFADQGVLADNDAVACIFEQNLITGCLLNHARTQKSGVLEIDGTDCRVIHGEYTASLTALTSSDAYCGAVLIKGGTHFIDSVVGEISDFGIAIMSSPTLSGNSNRVVNCRADLNWGNGWEISAGAHLSNCLSYRNGRAATNTYDGFEVAGNDVYLDQCVAAAISTDSWVHRYGFSDVQNSDSDKNQYANCQSLLHGMRTFNFNVFSGPMVSIPSGPMRKFTDGDATPSVDNYRSFETANTAATSITFFDDGVSGQEIMVIGGDANTTFKNSSTLRMLGSADVTTTLNKPYKFFLWNGIWHQTL